MSISVVVINEWLEDILTGTLVLNIIRMIIGALIGVIVYFVITMLLKVNQIKDLISQKSGLEEES